MSIFTGKVQPAVRKETGNVSLYCLIGLFAMWIAFFILNWLYPDNVPFDYRIFLGGIAGSLVAVFNFFLMGLAVQKVAAEEDEGKARNIMKASYTYRMLLQILWIIAALIAPCFQCVAGIVPLLFPTLGIKIKGILAIKFYKGQEVEHKQDGC